MVVFAASAGKSKLLYPTAGGYDGEEGPKERPNVYSPFGMLDQGLERGLKDMIAEEETRMDDQDGEGLNGASFTTYCCKEPVRLLIYRPTRNRLSNDQGSMLHQPSLPSALL